MKYLIISFISILGLTGLSLRNATKDHPISDYFSEGLSKEDVSRENSFAEYWYTGLGELSGYELSQSRYGEIHKGRSVMIFVTEPFSRKSQVKLDDPESSGNDKVSVMKMNTTRKFQTGIYPYSMMTSVFNPINLRKRKSALKTTMSGQEWCGQVFQQLNLESGRYDLRSYSYFEDEGDQHLHINSAILEDELFNLIRINPNFLPLGETMMIPSQVVNRFKHEPTVAQIANCKIEEANWNGVKTIKYSIVYTHNSRTFSIYYSPEFPFVIEGWEDSFDGNISVSKRINTMQLDYWTKHNNGDEELHELLFTK